jgi:hypothetical protein
MGCAWLATSVPYSDGSYSSDTKNLLHRNDKGRRWEIQVSEERAGFAVFVGVTGSKDDDHTIELSQPADKEAYLDSLEILPPRRRDPIRGVVNCGSLWGEPIPTKNQLLPLQQGICRCHSKEDFVNLLAYTLK